MSGALARIDVVSIDATDVDPNSWTLRPVYIHEQLDVPLECDPIYEGRKLGVLNHKLDNLDHFDLFYTYLNFTE